MSYEVDVDRDVFGLKSEIRKANYTKIPTKFRNMDGV